MRNPLGRTATGGALYIILSLLALASAPASAQVNSWINPASGSWDDASSWSLSILPSSSQSVQITNSLWKAVAINASTPLSFPEAMTVSSLTIRGAWDTENTLLLNYFGTAVPLTVLNGLTLQDNARLVNFSSGLVVQSGTLTVTNAQMSQDGGLMSITSAPLYLQNAEYDLTNGVFEGGQVLLGLPVAARFNQYGGTVVITNLVFGNSGAGGGGTYALYGGYLNLPNGLSLNDQNNSSSSYFQAGGTNQTAQVFIEPGLYGHAPGFQLNGGLLVDGNVELLADNFGTVTLEQNGGTHFITNTLAIAGAAANGYTVLPATYRLNEGTLSAGVIELNANAGDSVFVQSNGTTSAGSIYAHSIGYYSSYNTDVILAGGTLSCSNFTAVDGGGHLDQSGGALTVSNLLAFGGSRNVGSTIYGPYTFSGGTLTASNINISGEWVIGDSDGTRRIRNPGSFTLSHTLQIGNAIEQLGRFVLASNATIDLAGSTSRLSFANSSGEMWASGAILMISDWNGNLSGGGAEQLSFGTDASGLTQAQLSQIQFNYSSNLYSAKILGTGEVVPDRVIPPSLAVVKQGNNLMLSWPSGWSLQTATNLPGPFSDLPNAASPYTVDITLQPQQFFRLRQ